MLLRIKKFFKRLYFKIIFSLSASGSFLYRFYVARYKPEQNSFDGLIDAVSRSQKNFFVIQVGANDGITHDPIHKFIRRDCWSGLLIEPQPYVYSTFLEPLHRKFREVKTVNAAIGSEDGEAELYSIAFSNERWATGLARFSREALMDLLKSGRLSRRMQKEGVKLPSDESNWIKSKTVKLRSFNSLFNENEVESADLLMIDTEGFDFEILKMFPWDRFKPALVAYECFHLSDMDLSESQSLLESKGYNYHREGPNIVAWLSDRIPSEIKQTLSLARAD